jgi:hypothetical protein
MAINQTLNYLLAKRSDALLCFGDSLTTSSAYLKCASGVAGDGLPMPRAGRVIRVDCWDGANLESGSGSISFSQGDRLSVYAVASGANFNVTVRVNGVNSTLAANGAAQNSTLQVVLYVRFD